MATLKLFDRGADYCLRSNCLSLEAVIPHVAEMSQVYGRDSVSLADTISEKQSAFVSKRTSSQQFNTW